MTEGVGRVEAFSDGVFAIAITLLILEIPVPHADGQASLWSALAARWPSYLAFVLSFFVILVCWVNHHELMRLISRIRYPFLFANGFVLLTVTFIPFPTAVLAEHLATESAPAAVTFYCATFVLNSVAWCTLFWTVVRDSLFHAHVDLDTIQRIRRSYLIGLPIYTAATLVSMVVPALGLLVNVSLNLYWVRLCYRPTHRA